MSAITALTDLAAEINQAHQLAEQSARTAIEHAKRAGELLIQAKAAVPHGQWLPWLSENITVGARQAQRYMRLAQPIPSLMTGTPQQSLGDLPWVYVEAEPGFLRRTFPVGIAA